MGIGFFRSCERLEDYKEWGVTGCLLIIYHVKNATIPKYGTHAINVENAEENFRMGFY